MDCLAKSSSLRIDALRGGPSPMGLDALGDQRTGSVSSPGPGPSPVSAVEFPVSLPSEASVVHRERRLNSEAGDALAGSVPAGVRLVEVGWMPPVCFSVRPNGSWVAAW